MTPVSCTEALSFIGGRGTVAEGSAATYFEVAISRIEKVEEDVGRTAKGVGIAKTQNHCWSKQKRDKGPIPSGATRSTTLAFFCATSISISLFLSST